MGSEIAKYFDPQVNGAGGVSYTDDGLDLAKAIVVADAFEADQLATLITTGRERFLANIRVVAEMCEQREDVRGIHLEGPFTSPLVGDAHPERFKINPDKKIMKELLEAGGGYVSLVTLDPSLPGALDLIKYLVDEGVTVSIGHTSASKEQFWAGINAGATALTHVPNGWEKSSDARRDKDTFVPELIASGKVYPMMITDRRHNSVEFVRHIWAAVQSEGMEGRLILVSDASPLFGLPRGEYKTFDGLEVRVFGPGEVVPERSDIPQDGYAVTWPLSGSMHHLGECVHTFAEDVGITERSILEKVGRNNAYEMLRVPLTRTGKFPTELE